MTHRDLQRLFEFSLDERSLELGDAAHKLVEAFELLMADIKFLEVSNSTYLPAARAYLLRRDSANYAFHAARSRRGRLGAASRLMYSHQMETFVKLVKLLCPGPVPDELLDWAWSRFQRAESRMLAKARSTARV
ncbi:MAG: hypothetical protein IT432_07480 [Phycisphaerales bacterium]|nr:hypothetical protein [Phycisphaerales bacterium]